MPSLTYIFVTFKNLFTYLSPDISFYIYILFFSFDLFTHTFSKNNLSSFYNFSNNILS